jgi:hypothetical protein
VIIARAGATSAEVSWRSLARRGMLWSEVQVFDVLAVSAASVVELGDKYYIEVAVCAEGGLERTEPAPAALAAGHALLLAPGESGQWTVSLTGATIVRLRLLPSQVAARLPRRTPVIEAGSG